MFRKKPDHKADSLLPESVRKARAALRGKKLSQPSSRPQEDIFPISSEKEKIKAAEEAEVKALRDAKPGQYFPGKGIFVGVWYPKTEVNIKLTKAFNVFAAPKDLKGLMTYDQAVSQVAQLKDWNGHDGFVQKDFNISAERAIRNAVYDRLDGSWFIPTYDILEKLYKENDQFDPPNALSPLWYWSSTGPHNTNTKKVKKFDSTGPSSVGVTDLGQLGVRCVRAELVP